MWCTGKDAHWRLRSGSSRSRFWVSPIVAETTAIGLWVVEQAEVVANAIVLTQR